MGIASDHFQSFLCRKLPFVVFSVGDCVGFIHVRNLRPHGSYGNYLKASCAVTVYCTVQGQKNLRLPACQTKQTPLLTAGSFAEQILAIGCNVTWLGVCGGWETAKTCVGLSRFPFMEKKKRKSPHLTFNIKNKYLRTLVVLQLLSSEGAESTHPISRVVYPFD